MLGIDCLEGTVVRLVERLDGGWTSAGLLAEGVQCLEEYRSIILTLSIASFTLSDSIKPFAAKFSTSAEFVEPELRQAILNKPRECLPTAE
jgi:hypothetical protein